MEVEDVMETVTCDVRGDLETWETSKEQQTRPHVTLTYAQSIDGSIAAERGSPTVLSGNASMKMTHLLRTLHDGILVGIGTILADNPSLNTRLVDGPSPRPIIVDARLRCPLSIKLFTLATCRKPILLCAESLDAEQHERRQALERAGATVIPCKTVHGSDGQVHIDLESAFAHLKTEGIRSVMVEGGASIIHECLRLSVSTAFVDRVIVTVAPTFIGGLHAVGSKVSTSTSFPRLHTPKYLVLDEDLIITGRFRVHAAVPSHSS